MAIESRNGERSLVGTWRLLSWIRRDQDGTPTYPFGERPVGYLVYTDDGHVFAEFMRDGPREYAGTVDITSAGLEFVHKVGFTAYGGTYETRDGQVVHHVELSLNPQQANGNLTRQLEWDGSRMVLTNHDRADGNPGIARLTFERAPSR